MKYIVDVPPELAKKVDGLINQGKYESTSQFANVAFQNQLLLEDSSKETLGNFIKTPVSETKLLKEQPSISNLAALSLIIVIFGFCGLGMVINCIKKLMFGLS